jgi:uncharacterized protein (TIGR03437 family)
MNSYLVGTDGTAHLAVKPRYGSRNFGASASMLAGAQVGAAGELTLDHGVFVAIQAPQAAVSLVNGSSLAPGPISSGALMALVANGLAPASARATAPLPDQLGGVRVLVNGQAAKLVAVSPLQVDFIAPAGLRDSATVQVESGGRVVASLDAVVAASSPGAVSATGTGSGNAQALHAGGGAVDESSPAKEGEVVSVFATGLGAVRPPVDPGAPTPATPPSVVDGSVSVLVAGLPGEVSFAGLAPGLVGVYRIDVKVPSGAATSSFATVPIAIATSDAFADTVDLVVSK